MIYLILYIIQISWYKHIFIHQLQQYKKAADHMITKNSGLLYPFFFGTYMVSFDTFLYYVCLSVLVRLTTGPNMSKFWSIGPKSERFTFLSIEILQMCLMYVMIISNSLQNKR